MIRTIVAARGLEALSVAAGVGTWGVFGHPVDPENPFLGLIALQNPPVFRVLTYGYATLWFTTAFFAASLGLSVLAIVSSRASDRVCAASTTFAGERQLFLPVTGQQRSPAHHLAGLG